MHEPSKQNKMKKNKRAWQNDNAPDCNSGEVGLIPTALSKNSIAKNLSDPLFRQRVVADKKKYSRKRSKHLTSQIIKEKNYDK
jgi:stalled ribosome alternative rescue factor ArfA